MTCNRTVYIDGSGSVSGLPFSMIEVGSLYEDDQWQVFEFSSSVRPFVRSQHLMSEGTNVGALTTFIEQRHMWDRGTLLDTVVIITDEDTDHGRWNELKRFGAHIFHVQKAEDVPLPGTTEVHCPARDKVFTCTVGGDGGRCKFCHLFITKQECKSRNRMNVNVRNRILDWYTAGDYMNLARYVSDPQQNPSIRYFDELMTRSTVRPEDLFGPIDIQHLARTGKTRPFDPSRPQEAHMSNKPTIVTSVTLARPNGNEQVIISDLKALIAEVERVGGDDTSIVALGNDARTWNVTLQVKANEIEREVALTDEERLALLDEYQTANKARKAEINKALFAPSA